MGIIVTVNSDDPPLFNTDLTHEYTILMDEFGYSLRDVTRIARNAYEVAAMPESNRTKLLAEFDSWVSTKINRNYSACSKKNIVNVSST